MAGLGSRFYESEFNLPKPLIKINKKPMFIQAAKSMPKADLNIFICNAYIMLTITILRSRRFRTLCGKRLMMYSRCTLQAQVAISIHSLEIVL